MIFHTPPLDRTVPARIYCLMSFPTLSSKFSAVFACVLALSLFAGCATPPDPYLDTVKQRAGVVALPSGLLYEVLRPGTGAFPKASDTVRVNYAGALTNGTVFDASAPRGGPATFPLNGVIPGWTEGLQKINVGGIIRLHVPARLAYGAQSPSPAIPPNSTLVFEVELLAIVPR
jgi:FKBP-type peptidyl-prolyl cis-trans isomerase